MNDLETQFLRKELQERIELNPRYSMRAFAQYLGINVGTLSSILNGQRKLTVKSAKKFCQKLGYSPTEELQILRLIQNQNIEDGVKAFSDEREKVDNEHFHLIANWYHYAICQLISLDIYGSESGHKYPKWFAYQLGISEVEAKLAIDRLVNLGLLERTEKGFYKRKHKKLTTENKDVTNRALVLWQKQLREKAIQSLENHPVSSRSMTSVTMAINPKKMSLAKKIIDKFQQDLSDLLESDAKEEVYQLTVSLFPLQQKEY